MEELADLFQARTASSRRSPGSTTRSGGPGCAAGLPEDQQVEALAHHPRIGAPKPSGRSAAEQGADVDPAVLAELAELNAAYEACFGFRFVVFVNRRSRAEIVPVLHERLERTARRSSRPAVTSSSRSRWTGGAAPEDRLREGGRSSTGRTASARCSPPRSG